MTPDRDQSHHPIVSSSSGTKGDIVYEIIREKSKQLGQISKCLWSNI